MSHDIRPVERNVRICCIEGLIYGRVSSLAYKGEGVVGKGEGAATYDMNLKKMYKN